MSTSESQPCFLLDLPFELQLPIYEMVVIAESPLLINYHCNSSYRGRYDEMKQDEQKWKSGELHPPTQPALSQTCRFIRQATLPIFYKENVFRASYCHPKTKLPGLVRWLRVIGRENREMLRHWYLYDRNRSYDRWEKKDLVAVKESEICTEMDGRVETFSNENCCAHLVTFGNHERRAGEVPIASRPGPCQLLLPGET